MWSFLARGGLGVLLCSTCVSCAPETMDAAPLSVDVFVAEGSAKDLFLDGFFPIGVFAQPEQSFAKWKSRGINTVLETPQGHDPISWDRAAQAADLKLIRRPLGDPKSDIGRKDLLAWSHWDEPDAAGRAPEWTPMFEKTAAEWRRIDPDRRIFINFAGPDLTWFTTRTDSYSKNYASFYPRLIATADWIANDIYPSGGWLNDEHKARRGDITLIAEPLKVLKKMTPKPLFAFVETSDVEAGNVPGARRPTVDEVRAQIWYAILHGVRGLFYFPAVVRAGAFQFDGTPSDIAEEMTRQNKLLTSLAPVLQGQIDPKGLTAVVERPIEIGWRSSGSTAAAIAVNTSREARRAVNIRFSGLEGFQESVTELQTGRVIKLSDGALSDDFPSLGVRVYLFRPARTS